MTPLTAAQRAALEHVRAAALRRRARDQRRLRAVVADAASLAEAVREHGRVTLNFHPDRLAADGRSVAEGLARHGRYLSQFETLISNGSRTAYPGGERDGWEERMFGGAYHVPGVPPADRPAYGGLNLLRHSDGASPRFGSCHLRLRPAVLARCTFCFGDSHQDPPDTGTIEAFDGVLAGLLDEVSTSGRALGVEGPAVVAWLRDPTRRPVRATPDAAVGRALDEYIEAQLHGGCSLADDVEALVLDPSFGDTETGRLLVATAGRLGIAVEWHAGFELAPEEVPEDFRGPVMPPLAGYVCEEFAGARGVLDAAVLGRAAASLVRRPDRWTRWGTPDETLQYVKQLWHVLVRYGGPRRP